MLSFRHALRTIVLDSSRSLTTSGTTTTSASTAIVDRPGDAGLPLLLELKPGENWLCWNEQSFSVVQQQQVRSNGPPIDCHGSMDHEGVQLVQKKNSDNNHDNNINNLRCCFICLDVDGPHATIKDMRTPDEQGGVVSPPHSVVVLLMDNSNNDGATTSSHTKEEQQPLQPRQLRVLRHQCQIRVLDHEMGAPKFCLLYTCHPESKTTSATTTTTTTTTSTNSSTASPSNTTESHSVRSSLVDAEPGSRAAGSTTLTTPFHDRINQRHEKQGGVQGSTPQSIPDSDANSVLLTPPLAPSRTTTPTLRASPVSSHTNRNTPDSERGGPPPNPTHNDSGRKHLTARSDDDDIDDDDDDENNNDNSSSSPPQPEEVYVETQVAASRVHNHHTYHYSPTIAAAETQDEAVQRAARSSVDHAAAPIPSESTNHHNNNEIEEEVEEEILSDLSETKDHPRHHDNSNGDPDSHLTSSDATMSDNDEAVAYASSSDDDDSVIVVTSTAGLERSAAFLTQPSSCSNSNNHSSNKNFDPDVEDENDETQDVVIEQQNAVETGRDASLKEDVIATNDSSLGKPAVESIEPEMNRHRNGPTETLQDDGKADDNSQPDDTAGDNDSLVVPLRLNSAVNSTDAATNLFKASEEEPQLRIESVVVGGEEISNITSTDETRAEKEPKVDAPGSSDPLIHAVVATTAASDAAVIKNETTVEKDEVPSSLVHNGPANEVLPSSPQLSSSQNAVEDVNGQPEAAISMDKASSVRNETCESNGTYDSPTNDSIVHDDNGCCESDEPTQPHSTAKWSDTTHIISSVVNAAPNNLPHGAAAQEPLPSSELNCHQEACATKELSSATNAPADMTNSEAMRFQCVATAQSNVDEKTASCVAVVESADAVVLDDSLSNHEVTQMKIDVNSPIFDGDTMAETAATAREKGNDGTPSSQHSKDEAATEGLPTEGFTESPQSCSISESKSVDASSTTQAETRGSKMGSSAVKRKQDSASAPIVLLASSMPAEAASVDSKSHATKRAKRAMKSYREDTAAVLSEIAYPKVAAARTPSPSTGSSPLTMQTPITLRPCLGTGGTTSTRSTRKRKAAAASDTVASSAKRSASTRKLRTPLMSRHGKQTVGEEVRILVTGLDLDAKQKKMVNNLGAVLIDKIADAHTATHVIAYDDKTPMRRTPKLMIALSCKTKNIVRLQWLIDSHAANELLPCENFLALDKVAENKYSFSMKKTLSIIGSRIDNDKPRLMDGWSVFVCKGVAGNHAPDAKELRLMVEAAGGSWLSSCTKKGLDFSKLLIITSDPEESKQISVKAVSGALENGAAKRTTSWLFDTLMKQDWDLM